MKKLQDVVEQFQGVTLPNKNSCLKLYLREDQVSALTGRAVQTLRNDRFNGRGFPYIKGPGRSIRYDYDDVVDFMTLHRVEVMS